MLVSVIVFTLAGLLLAGVSLPLIRRRVPPGAYGLRTPATFADEWVWYEANAKSGRGFLVFGLAFAALAAALPLLAGLREPAYTPVLAIVLVAGVIGVAAVGSLRAGRLLRARRARKTASGR